MITQEELRHRFRYSDDGKLIYKINYYRAKVGNIIGNDDGTGHLTATVNMKNHKVHRLVWIYHYGKIPKEYEIDHINRVKYDNRIENLRLVTRSENSYNKDTKGYCFDKQTNKYRAFISKDGKKINIGRFETEEEARSAYLSAKEKYHIIKDKK